MITRWGWLQNIPLQVPKIPQSFQEYFFAIFSDFLGKRVDDPLPVHLSVDILSFDQIDTVNMMIAYVF